MRLVATNQVKAGERLGKPIYDLEGRPLLRKGAKLTDRLIQRLINLGIYQIYIEDERTEGIEYEEVISERTRRKAIQTIKKEFTNIADEMKLKKVINGDRLSVDFSKVVQAILSDIKSNKDALSILSDVYIYDNYIFTHSLNVTVYTLGLAVKLGFNERQLLEIGFGALLHDVGKMAIPAEILNKPGKLTDEEFELIKTHPEVGFNMLRKLPNISLLTAHCALQHHERINGSGYPFGLKGDEIHEYAKIIGIADVFDAVTSHRSYRKPMLPHEALELLYTGVGTLYDMKYIQEFNQTIAVYPIGLTVTLSDGRVGIVVKQNKSITTRPVVRIIQENGVNINNPYDVDLVKDTNVTIVATESTLASKTG